VCPRIVRVFMNRYVRHNALAFRSGKMYSGQDRFRRDEQIYPWPARPAASLCRARYLMKLHQIFCSDIFASEKDLPGFLG
jgi:hypothetical protein